MNTAATTTGRDLLAALDAAMQRTADAARRQGATEAQADACALAALTAHLNELDAMAAL